MLAPETINSLQCFAWLLSEKRQCPYSVTFGCIESRMGIAIIQATHLYLGGTHVKSCLSKLMVDNCYVV